MHRTNRTTEASAALTGLNLFGQPFALDPYPALEALRRSSPVHHDPNTDLWLVSRHRDVRTVLLDPRTFLPDNAQRAATPLARPALRSLARARFALPPALANNGGPTHQGLRSLVSRFLDARRVAAAVPLIERRARQLALGVREQVAAGEQCDLVRSFTRVLPCQVLMDLLGIRGVDVETLADWSEAALELFWGRPSPERQLYLADQAVAFHTWLSARINGPAEAGSLIQALQQHRVPDGTLLDTATAVSVCFFVFVAGHSTTGQLIATTLRRALEDGRAWACAASEAGFAEKWSEEVLRREPSVTSWRRTAARDAEIGGVTVPAGAQLLLLLMGTGSDTEVFPEPERLCPHRENTRLHLSFGVGRHRCPGALLARTETAVALRTAASLIPELALVPGQKPPMLDLLSFRAPRRLLVHLG
ncbi:cytochrome P450 [Streptomyces sp. NPDC047061]|uniref:cytochrome P450 n=1 Tax=Streptomyces sp. NPDC047061 TaxID=3154605 RepID=UPI00340BDD17